MTAGAQTETAAAVDDIDHRLKNLDDRLRRLARPAILQPAAQAPSPVVTPEPETGAGAGADLSQTELSTFFAAAKTNCWMAAELGLGPVKQQVVALVRTRAPRRASAVEMRPVSLLSLSMPSKDWARIFGAAGDDAAVIARSDDGIDIAFGLVQSCEDHAARAMKLARTVAAASVRAAVTSGYLLAGIDHLGRWTGGTVAGQLIGATRALRDSAPLGAVLVDEATRDLLRLADNLSVDPVAFPLSAAVEPNTRRGSPAALVGRAAEIKALLRQFEDVRLGFGRVAWIEGEAGMGKSMLAAAIADCARAVGVRWLEHRCRGEGDLRRSIADGLRSACIPDERPFALAVDDVHLAQPDDCALLLDVARSLHAMPVLLLLIGRSPRLVPLQGLKGHCAVRLSRLSPREVRLLARAECGGTLADTVLRDIVRLARGVPFFAAELTRSAMRGQAPRESRLPLAVSSLVMSRLNTLRPNRKLLRLAARSEPARLDDLRLSWGDVDGALEAAVEQAVNHGLLVRESRTDGEAVRFAHPIVGRALAELLAY